MSSCASEQGSKVTGGNLSVYFDNDKDQELATEIAHFWQANDLIADQPQDIKLTRYKKGYRLALIARDKEDAKIMMFKERKALMDLQSMLKDSIFQDKKFEIIVTDDRFKPIVNINK